jgi:[1-hydroxy-2-(trimethylamino)ethyl]phosphonate dioxygenase
MLAERAGAGADLITASLLHDIGHMLHRDAANALQQLTDDHHEQLGAKFLRRWFKPTVTEPVAMHVAAKRYLCTREPGYLASLSPVSLKSLAIQGGPMSARQADDFEALPGCNDALSLRRWDELSKDPALITPSLGHFLKVAAGCLSSRPETANDR